MCALGPSLEVNGAPLPGTLANPTIQLNGANGVVLANDDWMDSPNQAEIIAAGLAPNDSRESAISPRSLRANTPRWSPARAGRRGLVWWRLMIFPTHPRLRDARPFPRAVLSAQTTTSDRRAHRAGSLRAAIVFRAIGPDVGVSGALSDPTLDIHDANGILIEANDNWRSDQETELTASRLAPGSNLDAPLIATLPLGDYTAVVRGAGGATGVALVEAFALE